MKVNFYTAVLTTLLTIGVAFASWAAAEIQQRPTKDAVKEMIEDKSPFSKDRSLIINQLEELNRSNRDLKAVIIEHTKLIAALKARIESQ